MSGVSRISIPYRSRASAAASQVVPSPRGGRGARSSGTSLRQRRRVRGRSPARLEERGEPDREDVQPDERDHRENRRDRIDARQQDTDNGHGEDADPPGAAQLRRREDAQPDEREDEDRDLERERYPQQHERREPVVVASPDQDRVVARSG